MLRFVVRRALVQRRMLATTVVMVAAATTLLGVSSLLLGTTQDRAFAREIESSQPQDVDVDAFLVGLPGSDLQAARGQAQEVVRDVLEPMDPVTTTTATSRMRRFEAGDGSAGLGYLAAGDGFPRRAELTAGHWPEPGSSAPYEAALPDAALSRLGLKVGDQVTLGGETGIGAENQPVTVVVVGTFRPRARTGWETDPLSGAGVDVGYSDGSVTAPAYGPFVVDDAALLATGSNIAGVRVTAHPDLRLADDAALRRAVEQLGGASALLAARVGDQADITRVASDLPDTVDRVHAQQATTRSMVLVVLLLGTMLSLAALLLAGRLIAAVRDDERALLVGFGLGRGQQLGATLAEALLVAAVSALLALPAAAFAHSRLTRLPSMRSAGLTQDPTVTWQLVATVAGGAVALTLALVVPALDAATTAASSRRRVAARSGVDLLLLAVAAGAAWQLHTQPATAETSGDLTLTVAPVLCLVAVTVVAVRVVPLLLAAVAGAGARSPALVLPLAANQAARRPHTGTAMVLLATSVAAAVFGVALRATWERSQVDQAALRVGTDLTLTLPSTATPSDAAAVAGAAGTGSGASIVSAVTDRPFALGHYLGDIGSPPMLVAIDSRHAGTLLRGRLDGETWGGVGARLSPDAAVQGVQLEPGAVAQVEGAGEAGLSLSVRPTVVIQDAAGFRGSVTAAPIPLDGRPHPVRWQSPLGSGQVVALRLQVDGRPSDDRGRDQVVAVSVELRLPGASARSDLSSWPAQALGQQTPVHGITLAVQPTASGTVLRASARVDLTYLAYSTADMLATAFTAPEDVPVAVSQRLADAIGVKVGGEVSANFGAVVLPMRVTSIVPTVPSAPGRIAALADVDVLSRALISAGRLDPIVDGWWVADPSPETVHALDALQLGDVTTREDVGHQLAEGPMRVTVPGALVLLVVAGAALLLAGAGLLVSADQRRRSAEVARLRALGLNRRSARGLLLAEHVAFLVPLVVVGALVGAAASVLLGPSLIRSDLGAAPVPDAVLAWPWPAQLGLLGGLVLGCVVIAWVASVLHVRRAETAQLRVGDAS